MMAVKRSAKIYTHLWEPVEEGRRRNAEDGQARHRGAREGLPFVSDVYTQRRYAVIEAPSILGLKPTGVDRLAPSLLEHGLADLVNARHAGRVEPPPYSPHRDPETGTLNARVIAQYTPHLADAVGHVLDRREFPLILGGDCSILLGAMLALKRRGRFGLLFIDGHADFYQPEANPNGEAASMDLALATGYGPALLTDLERRRPLVRPEDAVVFGFRDAEEQRQYGSQPLPANVLAFDLMTVRRMGVEHATRIALERVARSGLDGFFIHVDADCLSDSIMPAVDYRLPDGFSWNELTSILTLAMASGRAVGLEVTIYNPALDDGGSAGRGLARVLVAALGTSAPCVHKPTR
jgi:arginase